MEPRPRLLVASCEAMHASANGGKAVGSGGGKDWLRSAASPLGVCTRLQRSQP